MAIDWASIRLRLEANERSLARAIHPDEQTLRAVHRSRMLRMSRKQERRDSEGRLVPTLVCDLCDERYGFAIAELLHAGRLSTFTPVWSDRVGVLGVFAWHGEIRTVVCARSLLGLGCTAEVRVGDSMILPRSLHGHAALRVDGFGGIIPVDLDSVVSLSGAEAKNSVCVRGRTRDGINVVDLAALSRHPTLACNWETESRRESISQ